MSNGRYKNLLELAQAMRMKVIGWATGSGCSVISHRHSAAGDTGLKVSPINPPLQSKGIFLSRATSLSRITNGNQL